LLISQEVLDLNTNTWNLFRAQIMPNAHTKYGVPNFSNDGTLSEFAEVEIYKY